MLRYWIRTVPALTCIAIICMPEISQAAANSIEDTAAICSACHGENGTPTAKNIPVIWGQTEGYLYLELRDFKKGARKNEIMSQIVADMDRETMAGLAAYFADKPFPKLGQTSPSDSDSGTAKTASSSIGCTGCHLDQYQGTGTAPHLSGQNHDYLLKTMLEFRSGERGNNPGMTSLMKAASETDIAALANYLAGF